jgi:uncharacterized protein YbjT (DUF2867 family)
MLVAGGHQVIGMTRTPAKQDLLRALGARPALADALDPTRWPGWWPRPSPR